MSSLLDLRRLWPTIGIPGIADRRGTYWMVDLDALPPIEAALDGTLSWLLGTPTYAGSLERGPDDPAERDADAMGLQQIGPSRPLPSTFRRFVEDAEPRRHLRSATACYLDLANFSVPVSDGGELIHFLSDQQWVLHWLLYVGPDGSEAVIATPDGVGYEFGQEDPIHFIDLREPSSALAVCADSFERFLYHYWAMNELFFRLGVDRIQVGDLPDELRVYAGRYPRGASAHALFD